ncbi:MAG: isoaspartyl peptidase/L-asparaginase family protein [Thermoplasmata archaeon]
MAVIVAHCGAGSTEDVLDASQRAVERGLRILRDGGGALEAVVEAVVLMEDDDRLNAGTGSKLNLDGKVEMDASVMDSNMNCGAVAAIYDLKNPILVARKVLDGPHVILSGSGAVRYAREAGFRRFDPITPKALKALDEMKRRLAEGDLPAWALRWWDRKPGDTVGAVARDDQGRMAAANSTGGISIKLPGRVGDTPLIGCGIYAGPGAAVTATGVGEEIIKRVLCKEVYDAIVSGTRPQEACEDGIASFSEEVPVGIVAVGLEGWGSACNTRMAWSHGEM